MNSALLYIFLISFSFDECVKTYSDIKWNLENNWICKGDIVPPVGSVTNKSSRITMFIQPCPETLAESLRKRFVRTLLLVWISQTEVDQWHVHCAQKTKDEKIYMFLSLVKFLKGWCHDHGPFICKDRHKNAEFYVTARLLNAFNFQTFNNCLVLGL